MSNFIQVKDTSYNDTFLLNIDNIVTIDFNSNHILTNGTHGKGHGGYFLDDESMKKLFVLINSKRTKQGKRGK